MLFTLKPSTVPVNISIWSTSFEVAAFIVTPITFGWSAFSSVFFSDLQETVRAPARQMAARANVLMILDFICCNFLFFLLYDQLAGRLPLVSPSEIFLVCPIHSEYKVKRTLCNKV